MYPIFKLINLRFLFNNQYIAPSFFIDVFSTFFLLVSPIETNMHVSGNCHARCVIVKNGHDQIIP